MNKGKTVFAQVMDFLPIKKFHRCVDRYNGNHRIRSFTCYDQKRLKTDLSLYTILQILSITIFEKMPILQAFTAFNYKTSTANSGNQLKLFNSYPDSTVEK